MRKEYNLVFSGSGDKFCTQIGTWFILSEAIKPKTLVGTSGGSIIASMIALDYSIYKIHDIINELKINECLDYYWNYPFSVIQKEKLAFIKGDLLLNHLKEIFPYQFKDCKYDLAITATDITNNELKVFSKQNTPNIWIYDAIRASISLPVIFHPHIIDGISYIDGGLSENFYLNYLSPEEDIIGIRVVDDPLTYKIDSIQDLIVMVIFKPIVRNEEKNIQLHKNVKLIELTTTIDNYDFKKLNKEVLNKQIEYGIKQANSFLSHTIL